MVLVKESEILIYYLMYYFNYYYLNSFFLNRLINMGCLYC